MHTQISICITCPDGKNDEAYAMGLGYKSERVQVKVILGTPSNNNPNLFPVGYGFGFVLIYAY